jgi:hypothetical protein
MQAGPSIPPTSGKYFFVNSATGQDSNGKGGSFDTPFDSLAFAVTKCVSNRGDVIVIAAGHSEDITTATYMDVSKNGVTIVGLGSRNLRPVFTLKTVVGATFKVSGTDVTIDNVIIDMTGINNVTIGVTVAGAGLTIKNSKLIINDSSAHAAALPISVGADRFSLENCIVDGNGTATGSTSCIASSAAVNMMRILANEIRGNFSTANITSAGSNHITNTVIAYNLMRNSNGTGKNIFNLTTSSTGLIAYNVCNGTTWSTAADVASNSTSVNLRWFQNFGFDDGAGAVSGVLVPAAGTIA